MAPRCATIVLVEAILAGAGTAVVSGAAPRDSFAACDARVATDPGAIESYRCYRHVAHRTGQHAEAVRRLRGFLGRDPRNDAARLALATVRAEQNASDAEELYRAAAEGLTARGQADGQVRARISLAALLQFRGQVEEGVVELKRAREAAEASKEPRLLDYVRVGEAWDAYRRNDYGRTVRLLEEAKPGVLTRGPADLQSAWLALMGTTDWALNRLAEAADAYRRQADLLRREGDRYEEAAALSNVAFMAGLLGRPTEERLAITRETLAAAVAGGNRATEGRAHWNLAELTSGDERIAHARRFLAVSRETGRPPDLMLALRSLAAYLKDGDPEEACRLLDEAVVLSRRIADAAELARNLVARARLRWATGPRDQAIADSLAALESIEAMRNRQPEGTVRARRFAAWANPYADFAGHLLAGDRLDAGRGVSAEDVELAFAIVERRRARTLLDEMDAAQAAAAAVQGGPTAERRNQVLRALTEVQKRLVSATLPDGEREAALSELDRLEREEEALRAEMARADPSFASLRPPRLAALSDVRATLADDEALLSFLIARRRSDDRPAGSWLIAQTRRGTRVHRLRLYEEDLARLPVFIGLIDRRDGSEAVAAVRLYQDLVRQALDELPAEVSRLVIVPDGVLFQLPFDALRSQATTEPLAARYEVSVVPSATLWLRTRGEARVPPAVPALALADPDIPGAAADGAPERQWALEQGMRLGRLPHARAEGRFVVRQLGRGSTLLAGPEATESFLKRPGLRRYGVVHIAAHSLVNDDKPDRSAILLAPGAPDEDGLLQIRELVRLDLRGDIVVLSACRSAGGPILNGEGVMGLARGFFQAGARTVVGSLWPLRDDEAEQVFRGFYRHLAAGATVGGSLSAARREAMRAGLPTAAWAGLVVLGDGTATAAPPATRGLSAPVLVFAALALGALLSVMLFVGRHRPGTPAS